MTLPIILMIPRCSCLRRAAKMWLFGRFWEGSWGCLGAQAGGDGAAAPTPLSSRGALRGEQHLCTRIANVVPTPSKKEERKKKLLRGNVEGAEHLEGLWLRGWGIRTCLGGGQGPAAPGAHSTGGTSVARLQGRRNKIRPLPAKKKKIKNSLKP